MKKSLRKIIPAIAMLMISAALVGTSTFAWFSMNSKVTVTGMSVTTTVKDDLLIAPCTTDATTLVGDSNFKTALIQNVSGLLEPVSTVNGVTYFYNSTKNTAKSGDALSDEYKAYTPADTTLFNTNYGTTGAVGYVDYAFQLKATNTKASAQKVKFTALNLIYGGSDTVHKAFRVAVFTNDMGATGATAATAPTYTGDGAGENNLLSIVKKSDAAYFTSTNAVSAVDAAPTAVKKLGQALTIGTVAANATNYYKVVVRLWLEGEDNTCNNTTFASLTDKWALDLSIELGDTDGISALTCSSTATKADLTSASLSGDTKTIDGQVYTKVNTVQLNSKDLYVKGDTLTVSSQIYQIYDDYYPIEVTNQCKLGYTITVINNNTSVSVEKVIYNVKADSVITATGITSSNSTATCDPVATTVTIDANKITVTAIAADTTITINPVVAP